jgi:hypothetical protein
MGLSRIFNPCPLAKIFSIMLSSLIACPIDDNAHAFKKVVWSLVVGLA